MASLIGCGFPWHNFWMFFLFGMEVFCSTRTITGVQNFNKVDFCPQNKTEWQKASTRLNCTNIANNPKNRYHCLPIYNLSTLMEFCYNETRPRVVKGLCMAYVQRSNALNSYNCSTFNEGCPDRNYFSDEVYEFPECTNINPISRCYAAESSCRPTPAKERKTKDHAFLVTVIVLDVLALSGIIVAVILRLILYKKRKKKKENEQTKVDENKLRGFLREKEIKISHLRCIIVGCAHAGKTTFLKRLETTNFEKLKNIKSTEMADVHVNIFEVSEDGETIESVKENLPTIIFSPNLVKYKHNETPEAQMSTNADEETETIDESVELLYLNRPYEENTTPKVQITANAGVELLYLNRPYEENTTPKVQITANAEILQSDEVRDTDKKINKSDSIKVETSSSLPQSTDRILPISNEIHQNVETNQDHTGNEKYAMAKIMDALEQIDKNPGPRITFIDFAGQSQYYAFLQIYLSPKTCYILVVDMTKSRNANVPDPDGEAGSRFVSWTYMDYYRFWLNSIDGFSDPEAQVIVVGTHADQISTEERKRFFEELFETCCSTHHRRHLNEKRCFTIGFPKPGLELEDLGDIKKYIASLVQDQVSIRPLWAIFEKIFEKEKKQKIISREMLSMWNNALSKDLQMNDAEISEMLLFFHTVGMLLYFDKDNLKETIILDIQWFSDAFKCIIAYHVEKKDSDVDRKHFQHTGELDDQKLEELWKREGTKEYNKHKEKILPYMEQLGLLAICNTESPDTKEMRTWYYIPSMNKRPYEIDDEEFSKSSILCFKFDEKGQLPIFVFYRAIVECMKIPEWSIFKQKGKNCIYENMACFSYQRLLVKICLCAYQIQVQVCFPKGESIDRELAIIQTSIKQKLNELKNYTFEIGYKCKNGMFNADDKNFISSKSFSVPQMKCEMCNKLHYVEDKICWVTTTKSENQVLCRSDLIGDKPGPSNYPFSGLHKSSENFLRLTCLITTICGSLLRDILSRHVKPADLRNELDINRTKLQSKMNPQQKEQIYLKAGCNSISAKDFDISVLYMLLRNICKLPSPKTGWGQPPQKGDNSESAFIERIRHIRNSISAHNPHGKVNDTDFQQYWEDLEHSIIAMEKQLTGDVAYLDRILTIKHMKFTWDDAEKYKRGIQQSEVLYRSEMMDDKSDQSSKNYLRLCGLITKICGPLLKDILSRHIAPANLRNEFDINRTKLEKLMTKVQREFFYLNARSNPISPKDLDISVLYMLLRNICSNIPKPKTGWENPPLKGDYSISACIERIRQIRNSIHAHSTNGKVDDTDFQNYWEELTNSIIETEKQLTGRDVNEDGISKIKNMTITSDDAEEYKREFPPQEDQKESEPQDLPKDIAFVGINAKKPRCSPNSKLVAAIDFGTVYSGHAFSSREDFENEPFKITAHKWSRCLLSPKTPTSALFDENKTLIAFGYEAEKKFRELSEDDKHHDHYFFERFKMQLYNEYGDTKQTMLTNKSMIRDISGKELPAMYVFSKAIEYMHDHLLNELKDYDEIAEENINWVLTVPAIWDDSAKHFMRYAAEQAGIKSENLIIALEPEAASMYCRKMPLYLSEKSDKDGIDIFSPGNQYLILDAGGGTVDIAIHEVLTGDRIKELHKATGGAWGGTYLDDEFFKIFEECFGKDEFEKFKKDDLASYIELRKDLEIVKRDISSSTHKISLTIPHDLKCKCDTTRSEFAKYLVCKGEKLEFDGSLIQKWYSKVCNNIEEHVKKLLEEHEIDNILMVGGFSESQFLQETMTKAFPNKCIVVPNEASLAVLKGAVLFGHKPSSIISRVAKFTYGVETSLPVKDEETVLDEKRIAIIDGVRYERGVFSKHVTKGANLEVDKAQYKMAYLPLLKTQKTIRFRVYASSIENPKYVDDPECKPLGYINVDIPDSSEGLDRKVRVRFIFGGTEIKVEGVNERTGEIASVKFVYSDTTATFFM